MNTPARHSAKPADEPTDLTADMLRQHRSIMTALDDFFHETPTAGDVARFAEMLASHLAQEDSVLYPELLRKGALTPAQMAGYRLTASGLSRSALQFVRKWTEQEPGKRPDEFHRDLADAQTYLLARMRITEEKLYPLI